MLNKSLDKYEKTLNHFILPDLEKGRQNWDRPHTEAVVYWMKELLPETDLNPKVMVTAAYAHDWGYIGLFPEGTDYKKIQAMKPLHMNRGAQMIEALLRNQLRDQFNEEEIKSVVHLVLVHDKLKEVEKEDEILLVEADTLGQLDIKRVTPTYSPDDDQRYLREVEKHRRPLFIHQKAIDAFDMLIQKRAAYFSNRT